MYSFATYKDQYKANLRLALPVVLTQLGQILTQVADNLMVGRYGGSDPTPLADRKSTRLNSSHPLSSRMPSSA